MVKQGPLGGAYSSQVIGAVVEALGIDQGVLKTRTAKRYFEGRTVSESKRQEIVEELGQVLIDRQILPVPQLFNQYDISMGGIFREAVTRAALRWDGLLARMQSRSADIDDRGVAIDQFLRLVIVDLSVRVFALFRMTGIEPQRPGTPIWAEENGGGKFLRQLTQNASLTREALASNLNVWDTTVDNWLDGKNRPTTENIAALAEVLAQHMDDVTPERLDVDIRRQFTFAHIADLLVPLVDRETIIELSTALVRFVWRITQDVKGKNRQPIEEAAGAELTTLRFGTAHPLSHTLLKNLAYAEPDSNWQKHILASAGSWDLAFELIAARTAGTRFAAGLAQDIVDVSPPKDLENGLSASPNSSDPITEALQEQVEREHQLFIQGVVRSPRHVLNEGIALRRSIVRDHPLSARAHLELGSFLGMAGKNLGRSDLIDEAILECKMSAELLPNWDNPAVEPGIILANVGQFEGALTQLKLAKENLPNPTPHLQFVMGYVLMNLSRFSEALEQLEEVLEVKTDHALAVLYASRCAFRMGDKTRGIRYAKEARRLGESAEYNAWRRGKYSTRGQARTQTQNTDAPR